MNRYIIQNYTLLDRLINTGEVNYKDFRVCERGLPLRIVVTNLKPISRNSILVGQYTHPEFKYQYDIQLQG